MYNIEQEVHEKASVVSLNNVLRVSIVCYAADEAQLSKTLTSLLTACISPLHKNLLQAIEIVLVNNGPTDLERKKIEMLLQSSAVIAEPGISFSILGDGQNLGFGLGHNLTFNTSYGDFHLVLNPDVELASNALSCALEFMLAREECGILAPAIYDHEGNRQYLCKRYPTVFDLLVRGFAPQPVRNFFWQRLAHYEMRDVMAEAVVWNPPIISGCFMLIRSALLQKIKGFDARYFLYFEDFDLSLRAGKISATAYVPDVKIIHHGGYAARKGLRHIFLFIRSAITFFKHHGWKWY